jgi:hypothetical protein
MSERFQDRLSVQRYRQDQPVELRLDDQPLGAGLQIPERLFRRLELLARAYELQVLTLVAGVDETELNTQQAASLVDELDFIGQVTADPLLQQVLPGLVRVARRCAQGLAHRLVIDRAG